MINSLRLVRGVISAGKDRFLKALLNRFGNLVSEVLSSEFLMGQIRHMIQTKSPAKSLPVVFLNLLKVLEEDLKPVHVLCWGFVNLAMLFLPNHENLMLLSSVGHVSSLVQQTMCSVDS